MNKIKVLIVDDSAFMRKALEGMLLGEEDIEIAGFGKNGEDAIRLVKELKPDVLTLDVEMPGIDGLTTLKRIMAESPLPVIMISSLTLAGADITLTALELGAVDFISKAKASGLLKMSDELKSKIRRFGKDATLVNKLRFSGRSSSVDRSSRFRPGVLPSRKQIVALGVSTGGPQSLQKVIPLLPATLDVPILVVQHMPPNFTHSLASRLNALSAVSVVEAQGGEKLEPKTVYIAKGGKQMLVRKNGIIDIRDADEKNFHNPSVDVLVQSVADVYGKDALGVIMTGMGSDGVKGLTSLKAAGGYVLSQSEETCIVYGMPRVVEEAGLADEVVPLGSIADRIIFHCSKNYGEN